MRSKTEKMERHRLTLSQTPHNEATEMKPSKKPSKPANGKAANDKPVPDGNKAVFNALLRQVFPGKPAASGRGKDDPALT